jgi:hypothetical protein
VTLEASADVDRVTERREVEHGLGSHVADEGNTRIGGDANG